MSESLFASDRFGPFDDPASAAEYERLSAVTAGLPDTAVHPRHRSSYLETLSGDELRVMTAYLSGPALEDVEGELLRRLVVGCPDCGRDLHGYIGPRCRYCDGTAE